VGAAIALVILVAAAAKSAQLPFSSWLPRAMEGPTPSSAIFYGSLAVHLGAFLLMRTHPLWEQQTSARIIIAIVGLGSTLIATGVARVQSSIKSQIAYASIAQIGLIFVEIAAGFTNLALFHFAGNAFLRTYQLLVSPSVVTYLIREQFYNFSPKQRSLEFSWPKRVQYSLYILCLKEWNLDAYMYRFLWNPLKWAGNQLNFLTLRRTLGFFAIAYTTGLTLLYFEASIPASLHSALPTIFSVIGLTMVLKAFTERKRARMSWLMVILNHFWIALAILFNEHFGLEETALYLSGIIAAGILGFICLTQIRRLESIDLDQFHGHSHQHPALAFVFLAACLAATGFPITPTFVGEDLIFSHIREDQYVLACVVSLSFILDGLAIIRIYARVFMGPHVKSVYEMGYRSS
jgi:NADH:ubiquinone oxidoreductase subunit 2 (subunit N)